MLTKCNDRTVFFNAKFECGNLRQVFQSGIRKRGIKPSTPQASV